MSEDLRDGVLEDLGSVGLAAVLALSMPQAPHLLVALAERQQRRADRLLWLATTPPFLSAAEDGHRVLASACEALLGTPMEPVRTLLERAHGEYEEMLEAFIAGELRPLEDAARAMMETEWLLRCFADDNSLVERWTTASSAERRKAFSPAALRKQLEQSHHQGLEMPDAEEYRLHSERAHISPEAHLAAQAFRNRESDSNLGLWFGEILIHLTPIFRESAVVETSAG